MKSVSLAPTKMLAARSARLMMMAALGLFPAIGFGQDDAGHDPTTQTTAQKAFIEAGDTFHYGYGLWTCVRSADDLFQMNYDQGGVRLNNITIASRQDMFSGHSIIEMRAAVSNRSPYRASVSVQLAGFDENDELVLAISMRELFGSVSAGGSQDLNTAIYLGDETITVHQYCIKPFLGLRS